MILTPLQKLPKNVGDLGKFIVAKGFKKLPKVQKIAISDHTGPCPPVLTVSTPLLSPGALYFWKEVRHGIVPPSGSWTVLF